jgi:hypothetical protein
MSLSDFPFHMSTLWDDPSPTRLPPRMSRPSVAGRHGNPAQASTISCVERASVLSEFEYEPGFLAASYVAANDQSAPPVKVKRKACRREVKATMKRIGPPDGRREVLNQADVTRRFLSAKCTACGRCPRVLQRLTDWKLSAHAVIVRPLRP